MRRVLPIAATAAVALALVPSAASADLIAGDRFWSTYLRDAAVLTIDPTAGTLAPVGTGTGTCEAIYASEVEPTTGVGYSVVWRWTGDIADYTSVLYQVDVNTGGYVELGEIGSPSDSDGTLDCFSIDLTGGTLRAVCSYTEDDVYRQ